MIRKAFFLFFFIFSFSFGENLLIKWMNSNKEPKIFFTQKSYIAEMEEWQEFKGNICIKTDKVKIIYQTPQLQEILIENNKAYIFSPEENQVIVSDLDNSLFIKILLDILKNPKTLDKHFKVVKETKNSITLKPKKTSEIKTVVIIFENYNLKAVKTEDKEGNQILFIINKVAKCKEKIRLNTNEKTEVIR